MREKIPALSLCLAGMPTQYFLQLTHLIRSIFESFTLAETNTKVNESYFTHKKLIRNLTKCFGY